LRALHLTLFTVPSQIMTFCEFINPCQKYDMRRQDDFCGEVQERGFLGGSVNPFCWQRGCGTFFAESA